MEAELRVLLSDLHRFGRENDQSHTNRGQRMLNITPETGAFLRMLVISGNHKRVLELGTSNGYSTIWLADGCRRAGGRVVTIELSAPKLSMALDNFRRAGVAAWIEARRGDIGTELPDLRDYDLIFLDTERDNYVAWWSHIQSALRPGGLLVVDNATSHASEMAPFVEAIHGTAGFSSLTVPIGNGELLVLKEPD